jgi:hypothetical protein
VLKIFWVGWAKRSVPISQSLCAAARDHLSHLSSSGAIAKRIAPHEPLASIRQLDHEGEFAHGHYRNAADRPERQAPYPGPQVHDRGEDYSSFTSVATMATAAIIIAPSLMTRRYSNSGRSVLVANSASIWAVRNASAIASAWDSGMPASFRIRMSLWVSKVMVLVGTSAVAVDRKHGRAAGRCQRFDRQADASKPLAVEKLWLATRLRQQYAREGIARRYRASLHGTLITRSLGLARGVLRPD